MLRAGNDRQYLRDAADHIEGNLAALRRLLDTRESQQVDGLTRATSSTRSRLRTRRGTSKRVLT